MEQSKLIDGKYEYFAFISYRDEGEDAEKAKWLQKKLEHYKLPTFIRKENPEIPKRISPIFEYKSETGNTPTLKEAIWKGLTSSKFLIVICSPRATMSKWLNDGILYFVESGLERNIIPFIIDGKPKADNLEEECFPAELLKLKDNRELQGININVDGRDKAAVKVISRMFDIKFDTLWQRYEREQRKKRYIIYSSVIAFAILALGIALWMWHLNDQISVTNQKLIKENICIKSREVLNLLEKGDYVKAKHQVETILELWNKECHQEIPEMEKALRALYRYQWRDGIVKLYSIPISDKQYLLSADSAYLYICDRNGGYERIVGYAIATGDSAKQVFPLEWQNIGCKIYDYNHGLVLCHNKNRQYNVVDNNSIDIPDTLFLYDQESGKKIFEIEGYYGGKIVDKDKLLILGYDTLTSMDHIMLLQVNNKHVTEKWDILSNANINTVSLVNDSLVSINDEKVFVLNVKNGNKIYEIDYGKDHLGTGIISFGSLGNHCIGKSTKQFAESSKYGLRLFSIDKHNTKVLDKYGYYGSSAFCPSGSLFAVVKYGSTYKNEKDSILIYINGMDFPMFAIEGDNIGGISFANEQILVETNSRGNKISVYSCAASFFFDELFSSTGSYYAIAKVYNGDSALIMNDSTEEVVCKINGSENRIDYVYDFSPQDTYFIYGTEKDPLVLHDINKGKDIVIPLSWNSVEYKKWKFYMSDDERRLLSVVPIDFDEIFTLYDIKKDTVEGFSIKVTREEHYSPLCYALSADGSRMAFSDGSNITIIGIDSISDFGQAVVIKEMENSSVREIHFSKGSSQLIAVLYSDGAIRFWNSITGEQAFGTIYTDAYGVSDLDISSDSKYLVGTRRIDDNWEYLVWHIPSGMLVDKETNAWAWWVKAVTKKQARYRAYFDKSMNNIIVNEKNLLGLSRKFYFPSFDELVMFYMRKE